uniref:Uncharacterized protein n=1 Tax=Fagus sylvatica TaxID=28930 RepID=A0A2N9EGA5_FAGSY
MTVILCETNYMEEDRVWFIPTQTVAWTMTLKFCASTVNYARLDCWTALRLKNDYKKMAIVKMEFLVAASLSCTPSGAVLQEQQWSHWNRYQATRLD